MEVYVVGRVIVDLYANEWHRPLRDVETFSKYLGGSAGNMAVGLARLGRRSGLISKVGDDEHGRFLLSYLEGAGVNTGFVGVDPNHRTALAFAALFPPADSDVLFYRDPCADTEVTLQDVDVEAVCRAQLLVVTGTTLVRSPMRETVLHLMRERRRRGRRNVMDVDYRPMLWTDVADSELYYGFAVGLCDVLIGNEAEIEFAHRAVFGSPTGGTRAPDGGTALAGKLPLEDPGVALATAPRREDSGAASAAAPRSGVPGAGSGQRETERQRLETKARDLMEAGVGQVVVKLGPDGAFALGEDGLAEAPGFAVDVVNTLGAGDGFASGFCTGLLEGWDLTRCLRYGNATGAIVVSRHGCAPAIPTVQELEGFLAARDG